MNIFYRPNTSKARPESSQAVHKHATSQAANTAGQAALARAEGHKSGRRDMQQKSRICGVVPKINFLKLFNLYNA